MQIQRRFAGILVFIVIVSLVAASSGWPSHSVHAQSDATITIDGQRLDTDVPPINRNGSLLVPMRAIFEALDAEVTWDAATKTAYATRGDDEIQITLDSHIAYVNGRPKLLVTPAALVDSRTMVPLRFVSENLDGQVQWDPDQKIASIRLSNTDQAAVEDASQGEQSPNLTQEQRAENYPRSQQDIVQAWQQYAPSYEGSPYLQTPNTSAPYEPGSLEPKFLQDGLNMANFVRYLAGLPDDLQLEDALNKKAQHGAVLLTAHGALTHTPDQPKDMSDSFYSQGYDSTTSSNIAYYSFMTTNMAWTGHKQLSPNDDLTLAQTVKQYMKDEDPINLPHVGHRRWILNPSLHSIGFGYADRLVQEKDQLSLDRYSTMQVFDDSRVQEVDYEYIAWPAAGYFPVEFFTATEQRGSDPWSITLNPDRYAQPEPEKVKVTLTRLHDGVSWELNEQDNRAFQVEDYAYSASFTDAYFAIDRQWIGVQNAIIFRPELTDAYKSGERYQVEISGLQTLQGEPALIEYTTDFFSLE